MPISGELGIIRLMATEQKEPQSSYAITLRQPHFSIGPPLSPRKIRSVRTRDQMAVEVEGVVEGGMRAEHALEDSPPVQSWARQGASEARGAHHHSDRFVVCRPLDRGLGNDRLRRCCPLAGA